MASEDDTVPLDLTTGEVTYKGAVYTFQELIDIWEQESYDKQDAAEELRDFRRDDQNLWGNKSNHFIDDWYYRKKPQKRRKGYPKDLE
jgi:hypothetical protein